MVSPSVAPHRARLGKHCPVPELRCEDHPDRAQTAEVASAHALVQLSHSPTLDVSVSLEAQLREYLRGALTFERRREQIGEVSLGSAARHGAREKISRGPTQDELGLGPAPSLILRQRQRELDQAAIVERESALHRSTPLESVDHLVLGDAPAASELARDRAL